MTSQDRIAALVQTIRGAADLLMCDEDNDNPCGTRPDDTRPEEFCNPCSVRRDLLESLALIEGEPSTPLRVLVTVDEGGGAEVDYLPEGITVEVRDFDYPTRHGEYEAGPSVWEYQSHPGFQFPHREKVTVVMQPGGAWRRADNARPEFDGPEPKKES